ncbi:MAG: trypsin-like serine protease [Pseudomonadota bacterium]
MPKQSFLAAALGLLALLSPGLAADVPQHTMLSKAESEPWHGVGRVNILHRNQRSMCTGTLLAPDIVLTAAHCLTHKGTGAEFKPGEVHFVAGWHKGSFTGHSRAAAISVHPNWTKAGKGTAAALGADIALIRLAEPIGQGAATHFDLGDPPLPGAPVTLISYRRDRAHALTMQSDCRYRAVIDRVMTLDCNVIEGASGSPVFLIEDGVPRVVAVLSAKDRAGKKAYATRVDGALADLLGTLSN